MNEMPRRSFGFIPDPPPRPDPGQPPQVIRDVRFLWLSLDLWPGPHESIPQVINRDEGDPS